MSTQRWLVELEGDHSNLKKFTRWFPKQDNFETFVMEDNGKYFLAGAPLDALSDVNDVYYRAKADCEKFAAVLPMFSSGAMPLRIGHIVGVEPDGTRHSHGWIIVCDVRSYETPGRLNLRDAFPI